MNVASVTMCYPTPWAPHRGLFVQRRLAALTKHVDLTVLCVEPTCPPLRPGPPQSQIDVNPPVRCEPMPYLPGVAKSLDGRWFGRAALRALRRMHAERPIDVVDAHFVWPDGVGAIRAARKLGLPVVLTLRGKIASACRSPRIRRQVKWALTEADALIAVSEDMAAQAREVADCELPVTVLPNAVDRNAFFPIDRDDARRQVGWNTDVQYVVSVGHVSPRKGFDRLLASWPEVRRRCGDVRLMLVGPAVGPRAYVQKVRAQLAELGDGAVWLGAQDPATVNVMINAADVFALATSMEGWCNAIAEAMAAGVPVVATDAGGNREQIADDGLGVLVPEDADATRLADALADALRRPWDREQIAAWRRGWTWQEIATRTADVLEGVVARHRKPRVLMPLTNAYDPDPRVAAEAQSLSQAGCEVTVLAWDRDIKAPPTEQVDGVTVRRIGTRSTHGRGLGQIWRLPKYWLEALRWARGRRFDVVHCHDFDTLPLGWMLTRNRRTPLIYDSHEVYTDMMVGHLPRLAVRLLGWLERRLVRRCEATLCAGDLQADTLEQRWGRRPDVVGNFKRLDQYMHPEPLIESARQQLGFGRETILISYIANLGKDRLLEPLIEAVAADRRFGLVIGGHGVYRDLAEQSAARFDNIRFLGRVAPERVPALTLACDVVYYALRPGTLAMAYSPPNKLYEALAAGRAMLAGDFGEIARVVREYDCGVLVENVTLPNVAEALSILSDRRRLATMQANARRAAVERYNWPHAEAALLKLYRSVLPADRLAMSDKATASARDAEPAGV